MNRFQKSFKNGGQKEIFTTIILIFHCLTVCLAVTDVADWDTVAISTFVLIFSGARMIY